MDERPLNVHLKAVVRAKGEKKFEGLVTVHWQMRTEAEELTDNHHLVFCCEAPTEKATTELLGAYLSRERAPQQQPVPTPTAGAAG